MFAKKEDFPRLPFFPLRPSRGLGRTFIAREGGVSYATGPTDALLRHCVIYAAARSPKARHPPPPPPLFLVAMPAGAQLPSYN